VPSTSLAVWAGPCLCLLQIGRTGFSKDGWTDGGAPCLSVDPHAPEPFLVPSESLSRYVGLVTEGVVQPEAEMLIEAFGKCF